MKIVLSIKININVLYITIFCSFSTNLLFSLCEHASVSVMDILDYCNNICPSCLVCYNITHTDCLSLSHVVLLHLNSMTTLFRFKYTSTKMPV